jgi:hypothetical protein
MKNCLTCNRILNLMQVYARQKHSCDYYRGADKEVEISYEPCPLL